jgi:hypothetical protein
MSSLINLTPHAVNICNAQGEPLFTLPRSGTVARVSVTQESAGSLTGGIPLFRTKFGEVQDLPECDPDNDVVYIVSLVVAQHPAVAGREDIASPGELIRDVNGQPVGCKGLTVYG